MKQAILILLVGLATGILASCGAQPTAQDDAALEDTVAKENTSPETPTDGETTEETAPATVPNTLEPSQNTAASPAVGANGMVSSADPLATQAGLEILSEGGNAFDAAVAVGAALNVVEPYMSGVGGYGAVVVYDAEAGETRLLDSGTRTPAALDPDAFHPPTPNYLENRRGAKAASTPGVADVWEELSEDYGELGWRRLFEPAIGLAEEGFPVGERTAYYIGREYAGFPANARSIYGSGGAPLAAGETLVQEDLAGSLRSISKEGADVVHGGALGESIEAAMRQNGGYLTIDDLRENRAAWRGTTSMDYRGYQVVTASPPLSAWSSLLGLGLMSRFDVTEPGHNTVDYLHRYAEVAKLAYAERLRYSGDPDPVPLGTLLSEDYWDDGAGSVDPSRAAPFQRPADFPVGDTSRGGSARGSAGGQEHTTHYVVADGEGNVVSATLTLGNLFGSRVMPEGTGLWINNSISYAQFESRGNPLDASPNRYRPVGICPTIVLDGGGRPVIALGTPGGRTITQTTPQMLMNLLDFEMDVQQAITAPRISFFEPDTLAVEGTVPAAVRAGLAQRGHDVSVDDYDLGNERGLGNAHSLTVEYDARGNPVRFAGGADPRGEGSASGY